MNLISYFIFFAVEILSNHFEESDLQQLDFVELKKIILELKNRNSELVSTVEILNANIAELKSELQSSKVEISQLKLEIGNGKVEKLPQPLNQFFNFRLSSSVFLNIDKTST